MTMTESPRNRWRQDTPGATGWTRTARPDDPDKYYMVSSDCHAQEPSTYLAEYIEPQFRDRIPRLSLIHISEPTRQEAISYAVFCL